MQTNTSTYFQEKVFVYIYTPTMHICVFVGDLQPSFETWFNIHLLFALHIAHISSLNHSKC